MSNKDFLYRDGYPRIGVTSGLRGFFAVLYDRDGPIQTGPGGYTDISDAQMDAESWAQSENIPCDKPDHRSGEI